MNLRKQFNLIVMALMLLTWNWQFNIEAWVLLLFMLFKKYAFFSQYDEGLDGFKGRESVFKVQKMQSNNCI